MPRLTMEGGRRRRVGVRVGDGQMERPGWEATTPLGPPYPPAWPLTPIMPPQTGTVLRAQSPEVMALWQFSEQGAGYAPAKDSGVMHAQGEI